MPSFTGKTLEALTGIPVSASEHDLIFRDLPEFHYQPVDGAREREIYAEVNKLIDAGQLRVVGNEDQRRVWEMGWQEVAEQMRSLPSIDIESLKPQYFHRDVPMRLLGNYVTSEATYFEYYTGIAIRRQLMLKFLSRSTNLIELGCGTGINLLLAAELFPGASLAGTDWTQATVEILGHISRACGRTIAPVLYNMLDQTGQERLPISPDSDVLTVHALEQLGPHMSGVIDFLIEKRPRRCLHIEPILDFYDHANPFDDIAHRYHLARSYLQGLVPHLRQKASERKIEITAERRVKFGNQFHEAYSYVVWKPL